LSKENKRAINVKLDDETKSKIEILAFIRNQKLQDLCEDLIKEAIKENADKIEAIEKIKD